MIKYAGFSVEFMNLPVHSPQQLQAFTDRLHESMRSLHPTREFPDEVAVAIFSYTPIQPDVEAEPMADSHAKA